ncbi:MAG: radical SAM protein [Paludibacter sp.]|nr:radical SAM protein [Paludibacter sp.]
MKTRTENNGLHIFDRINGLHILMDEYNFPKEIISIAPRTLSIALTNQCNLKCHYCYAPKNNNLLPIDFVKQIAKKFDELGTLELTFGGGEPFMYPEITNLIEWIWENTKLGINITTNGHLINTDIIEKIKGNISSLRFSIDGLEPKYSRVKKVALDKLVQNIHKVKGIIPFGVNVIINSGLTKDAEDVIELAIKLGAIDVLLIPEHQNGEFLLEKNDWKKVENLILKYKNEIQINVTYDASIFIHSNYLETEVNKEFLFAHISADRKLKLHSYENEGTFIDNFYEIEKQLQTINQY